MFRSPTDASSSESSSSDEEIEVSRASAVAREASDTTTPRSATQHVNLITASLLEFHYAVRAAELLNFATPGARYDRNSPEAQVLAKRMFAQASRLLASHGMMSENLHTEEFAEARQRYMSGIDSIGLHTLRDAGVLPTSSARLAIEDANSLTNPISMFSVDPFTRQQNSFLSHINQINLPPTLTSMQLSPGRSRSSSRYNSDFAEVRILGRGGFGTVYHVVNIIDNQHYAIKKIGIDLKRIRKRLKEDGQNDVENILREVRTLANLEHCNIVRYFSAWVEGLDLLEHPGTGSGPRAGPSSQKLLAPHSAQTELSDAKSFSASDGIVFAEDSEVAPPGRRGSERFESTMSASTLSLTHDSDIFTDGDGSRGVITESQESHQIVLHLQMSLHPLSLSSYLTQPPSRANPSPRSTSTRPRHCFHLQPSLCLFLAILTGVEYLHDRGICHRDLKPANIFLSEASPSPRHGFVSVTCVTCPEGAPRYLNARIGDFGLVGKFAEELSAGYSGYNVGTEFYRPPAPKPTSAVVSSKMPAMRVDEKIDVFALGVVLFELLYPLGTKTERSIVLNKLTQHSELPKDFVEHLVNPGVPRVAGATVADCIVGMLDKDPATRWDCGRARECVDSVLHIL